MATTAAKPAAPAETAPAAKGTVTIKHPAFEHVQRVVPSGDAARWLAAGWLKA